MRLRGGHSAGMVETESEMGVLGQLQKLRRSEAASGFRPASPLEAAALNSLRRPAPLEGSWRVRERPLHPKAQHS